MKAAVADASCRLVPGKALATTLAIYPRECCTWGLGLAPLLPPRAVAAATRMTRTKRTAVCAPGGGGAEDIVMIACLRLIILRLATPATPSGAYRLEPTQAHLSYTLWWRRSCQRPQGPLLAHSALWPRGRHQDAIGEPNIILKA